MLNLLNLNLQSSCKIANGDLNIFLFQLFHSQESELENQKKQ